MAEGAQSSPPYWMVLMGLDEMPHINAWPGPMVATLLYLLGSRCAPKSALRPVSEPSQVLHKALSLTTARLGSATGAIGPRAQPQLDPMAAKQCRPSFSLSKDLVLSARSCEKRIPNSTSAGPTSCFHSHVPLFH